MAVRSTVMTVTDTGAIGPVRKATKTNASSKTSMIPARAKDLPLFESQLFMGDS